MKQRRRIYYTESQKALMWERWRKGDSLQHIAQLFDRNHSSVQGILAQTGGIRSRKRTAKSLSPGTTSLCLLCCEIGHSTGRQYQWRWAATLDEFDHSPNRPGLT